MITPSNTSFVLRLTDFHEVINAVKESNTTNLVGIDIFSLLKVCSECLAAPLVYITNPSFQQGIFSEKMKTFVNKPIHKKEVCSNRLIPLPSNTNI